MHSKKEALTEAERLSYCYRKVVLIRAHLGLTIGFDQPVEIPQITGRRLYVHHVILPVT